MHSHGFRHSWLRDCLADRSDGKQSLLTTKDPFQRCLVENILQCGWKRAGVTDESLLICHRRLIPIRSLSIVFVAVAL